MRISNYIEAIHEKYNYLRLSKNEKILIPDPRPRYTEFVPVKDGKINLEFIFEPPYLLHFSTPNVGSENVPLYDRNIRFNLSLKDRDFELFVNQKKRFSIGDSVGFNLKANLILFYTLNVPPELNLKFCFGRNLECPLPPHRVKVFKPVILEELSKDEIKKIVNPHEDNSLYYDELLKKRGLSDEIYGIYRPKTNLGLNYVFLIVAKNWMHIMQYGKSDFNILYDDIASVYSVPFKEDIRLMYILLRSSIEYQQLMKSDHEIDRYDKRQIRLFEMQLPAQDCIEFEQFLKGILR